MEGESCYQCIGSRDTTDEIAGPVKCVVYKIEIPKEECFILPKECPSHFDPSKELRTEARNLRLRG